MSKPQPIDTVFWLLKETIAFITFNFFFKKTFFNTYVKMNIQYSQLI